MSAPKRIDANQPDIVRTLRDAGCSVQHLHTIGKGCPDILIGIAGVNILAEIKDGSKPLGKQCLTPDESDWMDNWRGQVCVVRSVDEALAVVAKVREAAHG